MVFVKLTSPAVIPTIDLIVHLPAHLLSGCGFGTRKRCARSQCPRQDSNLRTALRRRVLYPLSYGGA